MKKVAMITGATSGIGEATAKLFAQTGDYDLIIAGRRADRLKALKKELKEAYGTKVHVMSFDVRDYQRGDVYKRQLQQRQPYPDDISPQHPAEHDGQRAQHEDLLHGPVPHAQRFQHALSLIHICVPVHFGWEWWFALNVGVPLVMLVLMVIPARAVSAVRPERTMRYQ